VEYLAPGHCTGEPAFAALQKAFGERYIYAGLGSTIGLDAPAGGATAARAHHMQDSTGLTEGSR
jgi:hypothetical protein